MTWWQFILLACAAIPIVLLVRAAWHNCRCWSCPAAKRAVAARHPGWRLEGTSHRAAERNRDVVAVFYQVPPVSRRPAPYLLVAVDRGSGEATELPDDSNSPYNILGRK